MAPDNALSRPNVAITGTGGFLGRHIAAALAATGLSVTAIGRTPPHGLGNAVRPVAWDGRQPAPASWRFDAVVDCAAALPSRVADPATLLAVNAALARGAVELAARTAAPLVYMSSQSAIGRPAVATIDDRTPPNPDTPYGRSKLAAEEMLAAAVADGRLPAALALRLPAVVGPGCHDNFPAGVAAHLAAGRPVPVFNPDGLYNAVVHADCVAALVRHLLLNPPQGFHATSLASRPAIPLRAAVAAIAAGFRVSCALDIRPSSQPSPTIDPGGAEALGFVADDTAAVLERFGREAALRIATPPSPR